MTTILRPSGGYEHKRAEFRLESRAIRERWPIPDVARVNMLRRIFGIMRDPESTKRDQIAAARVLIQADGLNLEERRLELLEKVGEPDSIASILEAALQRAESGTRGEVGPNPGDQPG